MTELGIGALEIFVGFHQVALQLTMVHAALDGAAHQTGLLRRVDKKIGCTQTQRGGHAIHVAVVAYRQHRHLHIEGAHGTPHRRP